MNRRSLIKSVMGVTAACALEVFGFLPRIKTVELVLQQKATDILRVIEGWGPVYGTKYRMAPADFREDDGHYLEFNTPNEAIEAAGFPVPEPWYDFNSNGWTPIVQA